MKELELDAPSDWGMNKPTPSINQWINALKNGKSQWATLCGCVGLCVGTGDGACSVWLLTQRNSSLFDLFQFDFESRLETRRETDDCLVLLQRCHISFLSFLFPPFFCLGFFSPKWASRKSPLMLGSLLIPRNWARNCSPVFVDSCGGGGGGVSLGL